MPKRNSPWAIQTLDDLSQLDAVVVDKRFGQRASAKKNRRNRHYEKQFIRNSLTQRAAQPGNHPATEPSYDSAGDDF
jgi:hypothetical protein